MAKNYILETKGIPALMWKGSLILGDFKLRKIERILDIYRKLLNGKLVQKRTESIAYQVNERTIQRDIDDIRAYLAEVGRERGDGNTVVYDRSRRGYRLERVQPLALTREEILVLCKMVLDSLMFSEEETRELLNKMLTVYTPKEERAAMSELLGVQTQLYGKRSGQGDVFQRIWELGRAVMDCHYVKISLRDGWKGGLRELKLKPVAATYTGQYFYIVAFPAAPDEDTSRTRAEVAVGVPGAFRMDRIESMEVLEDKYLEAFSSRYTEFVGLRRSIHGDSLRKVLVTCRKQDVPELLGMVPEAEVLSCDEKEGNCLVQAFVFRRFVHRWLEKAGDKVQLLTVVDPI